MNKNTLFPIADRPTVSERKKFGLEIMQPFNNLRAVWTGEKRTPKKGEWYLSGAIVEAYKAPNDLSTVFHIAKLVKIKREMVERIVQSE